MHLLAVASVTAAVVVPAAVAVLLAVHVCGSDASVAAAVVVPAAVAVLLAVDVCGSNCYVPVCVHTKHSATLAQGLS